MPRVVTTLSKKLSMNIYLPPEDLSELAGLGYRIVDEGSVVAWIRVEPGGIVEMRPDRRDGFRKRSLNIKNDRRYVHACLGGPQENDLSPEGYPAPWRLREAPVVVGHGGFIRIHPPIGDVGRTNLPVVVPDFFGESAPDTPMKSEADKPASEDHLFVVGAGPVTMEFSLPQEKAAALIYFLETMGVRVRSS